jgi:MFS transporter, DHA2 family, multidrug resistance protein
VAAAPNQEDLTDGVQATLEKSFSSAETVAEQYPQYSSAITAGAKQSFLDGANWAYLAGIIAILIGATLVFLLFPRKEAERQLLADYHAQDAGRMSSRSAT